MSTPTESFTLISTRDGVYRCVLGPAECTRTTGVRPNNRFAALLRSPSDIIRRLGTSSVAVTHSPDRSIVEMAAECFTAVSDNAELGARDEWCFGSTGVLLAYSATTSAGSTTSLEAMDVSMDVAPTALEIPGP